MPLTRELLVEQSLNDIIQG